MGTKTNNQDSSTKTDVSVKTDESAETVIKVATDFTDEATVSDNYASSDQKGKAALKAELRKLIETVTRRALDTMDLSDVTEAKRLNALNDALRSTPVKSVKEVDYAGIVAERIASLRIAAKALESDPSAFVPEGVELDIEDIKVTADALYNLPNSDIPDSMVKSANSFVSLKFGKSDRNDIAAHIAEWAQSVPSGTFGSCQTIANFRSNEYGTDKPSSGAVAARLFPTDKDGNARVCTLSDVSPVDSTATSPRGAITL